MTIESDVAWLSIVEKITSNGYVYAKFWPNPKYPNLDYLFSQKVARAGRTPSYELLPSGESSIPKVGRFREWKDGVYVLSTGNNQPPSCGWVYFGFTLRKIQGVRNGENCWGVAERGEKRV